MGMLPHTAQDLAFCAHPAAFDATLHLLGAAAQLAAGHQPLRVPAFVDGLICHSSSTADLCPVAMPAEPLEDGSVHCSYRMLGQQGPALELGKMLAKEMTPPQQPAAAAEDQADWQVTYETQQQAVQATQLTAGPPSKLHALTALPAISLAGSLRKGLLPEQASPSKGSAIRMLASRSAEAVRLFAAGLHLTQQACKAAASSVAVLSRSGGTVQPGRLLQSSGHAGMAAMLKVAAAEHPGTLFTAASCGPSSKASVPEIGAQLAEVRCRLLEVCCNSVISSTWQASHLDGHGSLAVVCSALCSAPFTNSKLHHRWPEMLLGHPQTRECCSSSACYPAALPCASLTTICCPCQGVLWQG